MPMMPVETMSERQELDIVDLHWQEQTRSVLQHQESWPVVWAYVAVPTVS